jgi:hypothetical protein
MFILCILQRLHLLHPGQHRDIQCVLSWCWLTVHKCRAVLFAPWLQMNLSLMFSMAVCILCRHVQKSFASLPHDKQRTIMQVCAKLAAQLCCLLGMYAFSVPNHVLRCLNAVKCIRNCDPCRLQLYLCLSCPVHSLQCTASSPHAVLNVACRMCAACLSAAYNTSLPTWYKEQKQTRSRQPSQL